MSHNLAGYWFWEFTSDPYGYIVAPSAEAAKKRRRELLEFTRMGEEPRRMERDEVIASCTCKPFTSLGDAFEIWTTARWLDEIEAADRREAFESEQAARQVELFP